MKSILMQFKREFWELKQFSFTAPLLFTSILSVLACLMLLVLALSGRLQFSMADEVLFSADKKSELILLFDSEQTYADAQTVNRDFAWLNNPVAQTHPELIRNESEIGNNKNKFRPQQHALKDDIENRVTQITDSLEILLLFLLIFPLVAGMVANKKDQSLLFWRSMPVSDFQVVCTKFAYVFLVIPSFYLLAIWAGLILVMSCWTLIEIVKSSSSIVAVYPILWSAFLQLVKLSTAFFFKILWFMPVYALLLANLMLATRYKTLPVIMAFSITIMLAIERQIFETPWINYLFSEYFSMGITYSQYIKWTVLWGDQFPSINYLWLLGCVLSCLCLIVLVTKLRQKQEA